MARSLFADVGHAHTLPESEIMKCLGRTKASNFRKRCTNSTKLFFCWKHCWQPFSALIVLLGIASAIASVTGFNLRELWKTGDRQIEPVITTYMQYPIKVEDDKAYRNKRNPELVVQNEGPIKIISLSCDLKIFVYDKSRKVITQYLDWNFNNFEHTFSAKEMEPFKELRQSCMGIHGEKLLGIYSVDITYYRESDMRKFIMHSYFFTENDKIFEEKHFKTDENYNQIIEQIRNFNPKEFGNSEYRVSAATDNAWFLETPPSSLAKKNADGSVSIVTPVEQSERQPGLPYLEIKPVRLKATNLYINEEKIADKYIEFKIGFEFYNTGDTTAVITKDGFDMDTTIEPGQRKYNTFIFKAVRGKDSQLTLKSFINSLDNEKRPLDFVFISYYRPSNDPSKVLKKSIHLKIGKKSFEIMKDQ